MEAVERNEVPLEECLLEPVRNKALSDLSGVDVESLAKWKVCTKSL